MNIDIRKPSFADFVMNSVSGNGNTEVFPNNTDSGGSARNELSLLKSALFAI